MIEELVCSALEAFSDTLHHIAFSMQTERSTCSQNLARVVSAVEYTRQVIVPTVTTQLVRLSSQIKASQLATAVGALPSPAPATIKQANINRR